MKEIELKGHSGCKVLLIIPDQGNYFVRKISKHPDYNDRLRKQAQKQAAYKSQFAFVPTVLAEGMLDGLYYFDMTYVLGETVASQMKLCAVNKIAVLTELLFNLIEENRRQEILLTGNTAVIESKIKDLFATMGIEEKNNAIIRTAFDILSEHQWSILRQSASHGDLTLENIIIGRDGNFYLIDFLDTYYDTWISDVSKLLLDLIIGWSFRYEFMRADVISENTKVRLLLLSKQFTGRMRKVLSDDTAWNDIYIHLLLDLLRVIPYIKDQHVYQLVNKSLQAIVNNINKGGLYDHINNSMCWPVYAISGN